MADEDLIISIGAKADAFNKTVDDIKDKTVSLEEQLGEIAKISGAAFAALTAGAGVALHAFAEAEKASTQLTQSLRNQGIFSTQLADKYNQLAESIQHQTGIDDDAIKLGFAKIQGFLGQKQITEELARATADLSTQTGDFGSASEVIARAIQGNVRGLKQYGIQIDDNLTQQERLNQIIEKVTQSFGGQAKVAGETVAGSFAKMKSAFSDVLEEIGERLAPAFKDLAVKIQAFLENVKNNKPLLDFIVVSGKIAAEVAGLVLALSTVAITVVKVSEAIKIAKVAIDIMGLSVRSLVGATGIGLLLIIASEIFLHWETIWPTAQRIFTEFTDVVTGAAAGLGKVLVGLLRLDFSTFKAGLLDITNTFKKVSDDKRLNAELEAEEQRKLNSQQNAETQAQTAKQVALAEKRNAELKRQEDIKRQLLTSQSDFIVLSLEGASAERIALQKQETEILTKLDDEKYKDQRSLLQEHLDTIREMQEQADANDDERRLAYDEKILADNAEFNALSDEQQDAFLEGQNQALFDSVETRDTIQKKAAKDSLANQIKEHNEYLANQQKFGTVYAELNKLIYNSSVQAADKSFGELTQLTQSNNSTLKSIGKAASVAQITLKTAESAMNIYAGFSTIPIVGPVLGVAGAAAAVAFGAEQIGRVLAAQEGGIVTGGIAGRDSVPSLLTPGELVVPQTNFNEVISAVAQQRGAVAAAQGEPSAQPIAASAGVAQQVVIGFDGPESEKVLTAKRVEARALGILRESV